MKRTIAFLLLAASLLLILSGCEKPSSSMDLPDEWVILPKANQGVFSESGYYYTTLHRILYFLDVANGGNVALCNRIGCKHDLETYPEDCEAFLSIWPMDFLPIVYENGKLYYTDPDYYGEQLYSRNADGTAKTHITTLGMAYSEAKKSITIFDYLVADGMLYYCGEVTGEVHDDLSNYTQIVHEFDFIRRVDLQTGKDELLVEDPARVLRLHAVGGNMVIYDATTTPDGEDRESQLNLTRSLILLNTETGDSTVILEKPFVQIDSVLDIRDNIIHIQGNTESGEEAVIAYDLQTGDIRETTLLPVKWPQIINTKYVISYDGDQKFSQIYDMENKTFLPGGIVGLRLSLLNIGKQGFIVQRNYLEPGSEHNVDYYYLYYCSFASLADGLQEEDLIPFSFVDCS